MNPKSIIVKTLEKKVHSSLCQKLQDYPKIRHFAHKINGEYVIILPCNSYYTSLGYRLKTRVEGDYQFLSTTISLILSSFIIDCYEETLMKAKLKDYQKIFSEKILQKMKVISSLILDENYPSENAKKLSLCKKDLIFHQILSHFHKCNSLTLEAFVYFSLKEYHAFLDTVLIESFGILITNQTNEDFLIFMLNNFLK